VEEVEYANRVPRDEEEGLEVIHGNGETVVDEGPPADEVELELGQEMLQQVDGEGDGVEGIQEEVAEQLDDEVEAVESRDEDVQAGM
jgi:hypothetical protein